LSGTLAYLLYAVFAVGGAGVCFALPRAERPTRTAGAVIGLAALALLVVLMTVYASERDDLVFTVLFSAAALAAAGRVITHPRPVYSALYFVLVVLAVACLLVLQQAEFLAVALVIIYAGAILVTYAFVIMLAQQTLDPAGQGQSGAAPYDTRSREPGWAVLAGFVTMAAVAGQINRLPTSGSVQHGGVHFAAAGGMAASVGGHAPGWGATDVSAVTETADPTSGSTAHRAVARGAAGSPITPGIPGDEIDRRGPAGTTRAVGQALMTRYVLTLELAGVLLLVALVGAIALARKHVPSEAASGEEKPPGQIGKEVPPF